ncbi:flagellar hook protein FlgE [Paracoccus ravus]|uniref:flagellar hook protein FlgE n=1 Tax=Paracoccus ravus TaxID=2447760 RepID=UPI00106E6027|nr:flagellar hook-basal body complex protein [Paracoccus ravus]
MSISSAMQAAVAGLTSNAASVGKISSNIANASTVGYKRSFVDMVTVATGSSSSVRTVDGSNVALQGNVSATSSATDLAISGGGFFMVSKTPNDPNASNYFLTRSGSFSPDENGNLRNAAGYYLAGFTPNSDGSLGTVDYTSTGSLSTVNVTQNGSTAAASSSGSLSGNLPASETGTGEETAAFNSTMKYYNALGGAEQLTFSWAASADTANLWSVTISGEDGTTYGTVDVTFFDSGATPGAPKSFVSSSAPDANAGFALSEDGTVTLTINNGTEPQTLTISLGTVGGYDGITQFDGDYTPQAFSVDGSEATRMASTEFDDAGTLWGIFENGDRRAIYTIPVATVANPDGLRQIDGNAYSLTLESGGLVLNTSGTGAAGSIISSALEDANVDIAQEMTDLIQVQRAYAANAKIITTADEMLQETTNLKR